MVTKRDELTIANCSFCELKNQPKSVTRAEKASFTRITANFIERSCPSGGQELQKPLSLACFTTFTTKLVEKQPH
jgi:hypothetical protein